VRISLLVSDLHTVHNKGQYVNKASSVFRLFDTHELGEVAGLIHVAPLPYGDVVGEELQGDDKE
jgi:hypothetical protein